VQKKLKYWQDKLKLNDWVIVLVDDCPVNDFVGANRQGETEYDTEHKSAVIRIIRKEEYGERILPFVKEQVLIHELLHIKFGLLWDSNTELQNALLHQYIEDLAKAFYEVKNECKQ